MVRITQSLAVAAILSLSAAAPHSYGSATVAKRQERFGECIGSVDAPTTTLGPFPVSQPADDEPSRPGDAPSSTLGPFPVSQPADTEPSRPGDAPSTTLGPFPVSVPADQDDGMMQGGMGSGMPGDEMRPASQQQPKAVYFLSNEVPNSIITVKVDEPGTLAMGMSFPTGGDGASGIDANNNNTAAGPDALFDQGALAMSGRVRCHPVSSFIRL